MKTSFIKFRYIFLLALFFGFFGLLTIFIKSSHDLPDYNQLKSYSPIVTTRLYAADGTLLTEYSKEKRIFVPIKDIPKDLINAFLAAEDSHFYNHPGIDIFAIFRTAFENIFSIAIGNKNIAGASTITQQVVKNLLLSNERTYTRKIKEAILAVRMTKVFTKDQILELYLNQIYLGSGVYGVAAASQVYFDKSIDNLSIEEMALLATLPKAPSKLDPRKNIEKARIRRNWVIERMVSEGFITKESGIKAATKRIILSDINSLSGVEASYFTDNVKKELTNLYGSDNVFEEGIVVHTTLDPALQELANKALQKGIESYDMKNGWRGSFGKVTGNLQVDWHKKLSKFKIEKLYKAKWQKAVVLSISGNSAVIGVENNEKGVINLSSMLWARKFINVDSIGGPVKSINDVLAIGDVILVEKFSKNEFHLKQIPDVNGAFIAMDPHTGKILAMVGGYVDAINQFNRATQAQRQPGSTMKPFGYIAALENGMNPATIVMDEPITLDQGPDLPPYQPTNYSNEYYGPTTLRHGLEHSINVTTIRMADQIGIDKVADVIKRFGVNKNPRPYYSIVLGGIETSLIDLTKAYGSIANGGKEITPSIIEKIQDRNGKVIYRREKQECKECSLLAADGTLTSSNKTVLPFLKDQRRQVTDSATAYQITSMLEGVVRRGTAARASIIGKPIAGKTGTTNSSFDSWFMGFSPDLVAGVYVGFDIPRTLGKFETGSSVALPVFIDFMQGALKDKSATPFRVPNSVKFIKIDRSSGKYPTPETPENNIFFEVFKSGEDVDKELTSDEDLNSLDSEEEIIDGAVSDSEIVTDPSVSPSGVY